MSPALDDFWKGDNADWSIGNDWSTGEPTSATPAIIGEGSVTIAAGEDEQAEVLGVGGFPSLTGPGLEATLTVDGVLTTVGLSAGNGTLGGDGIINTTEFQQGSQIESEDFPYITTLSGSLNVTASTVLVGGGMDQGFILGSNATLIGTGTNSVIYQGFINGTGTLQNGTKANNGTAVMTFYNSDYNFAETNGGSPFNDTTSIGAFTNWGTAIFSGVPNYFFAQVPDDEGLVASVITNNGVIQFGSGASNASNASQDGDISAASFINNGQIDVLSGLATIGEGSNTALTGQGNIVIEPGATLRIKLDGSVSGQQFISFGLQAGGTLALDGSASVLASSFQGQLEEFVGGDVVDLTSVAPSSITSIGPNSAGTGIAVTTKDGSTITFLVPNLLENASDEILVATKAGAGTDLTFETRPPDSFLPAIGQWTTPGNWSISYGGGVPTVYDTAVVTASDVTIGAGQSAVAATLQLAGNNSGNAVVDDQGSLELYNPLEITTGSTFNQDGGSLGFADSSFGVTVDQGGLFKGSGSLDSPITDNGTVEAVASTTLDLLNGEGSAPITGIGTLKIDANATIEAPAGAGLTVDFGGPNATFDDTTSIYGNPTGPTLQNMSIGDSLALGSFGAAVPTYKIVNNQLTFTEDGTTVTFNLLNPLPDLRFIVTNTATGVLAMATDDAPPVIDAPALVNAENGIETPINGLTVTDSDPVYTLISVTVSLQGKGVLSMSGATGSPGGTLRIKGTEGQIRQELGTLAYTGNAQNASITVSASNNGPTGRNQATPQTIQIATFPADAIDYTASASGDWGTGSTWSGGVTPGATNDAVVEGANTDVTVTDPESAKSLLVDQNAEVDVSGALSLVGPQSAITLIDGVLNLSGELLGNGGVLSILAGGNLTTNAFFGNATLDDLNVVGPLNVSGNMTIQDGFSIEAVGGGQGQIDVSLGQSGFSPISLEFTGKYTLDNAAVTLQGANGYDANLSVDDFVLGNTSTLISNGFGGIGATDFTNNGEIIVNPADSFYSNSGTDEAADKFTNNGQIIVDGGDLSIGSPFDSAGTFINNDSVTVENNGSLSISSSVEVLGSGIYIAESGGAIEVGGAVHTNSVFQFDDPATLILDDPIAFDGIIAGFAAGDVLTLTGETITGGVIKGTVLTLSLLGGGTQTLNVAPGQSGVSFTTTSGGGLMVSIPTAAPVISAPATATIGIGQTAAVSGIIISETGSTATETFTVKLSDSNGLLSAAGKGVSGSGTTALTIFGTLAQVNADLVTLKDTDAKAGSDTITLAATDSLGNTGMAAIAVTVNGLPVLSAPATATVAVGQAIAVTGVSLAESGATTGETFTIKLTDSNGLLSASGKGVSGSGSKALILSGSLAEVTADLATLKDLDATLGSDTITLSATDSLGNTGADKTISVTTASTHGTPGLTAPASASVAPGTATTITGLSLTESPSAADESFTVTLSDSYGLLSGAGISGSGGKALTLTGSLAQVNADLKTITDTDLTAGADKIILNATDSFGGKANPVTIAVTAGSTITSSMPVIVHAGETSSNLTVGKGSSEILLPDATATGTTIATGGVLGVAPGATVTGTVIDGGVSGVLGKSIDTQVNEGGYEVVGESGTTENTVIHQGGYQYVIDGGTATNTTIAAGGTMLIGEGGKALGSIDFAGSDAVLSAAGTIMPSAVIEGSVKYAASDAIILTGFTYAAGHDTATLGAGGILTLDLNGEIEKLHFNPSESNAGHSFSVTANSLDQVVVIDPLTGASPNMDFLAPATEAGSTNIMQQVLGRSAGLFLDYYEHSASSAAFLPAIRNFAAIDTLDTLGSPAAGASLASLNLPGYAVSLIKNLTAHG